MTDAEPESLAEDDEKELSVVHPARPTTELLEPAEVSIGSDVERDSWVFWWNFESGRKPGHPAPDV